MSSFFRGTSAAQDPRFADKEKKLRAQLDFPACFAESLDVSRVALPVVRPWLERELEELLGFDDEVLVGYIMSMLEEGDKRALACSPACTERRSPPRAAADPQLMQINVTGFLGADKAPAFMEKLWQLLLSAQNNVGGIPTAILEAKKAELRAAQADAARVEAHVAAHMRDAPPPPRTATAPRYYGASPADMARATALGDAREAARRGAPPPHARHGPPMPPRGPPMPPRGPPGSHMPPHGRHGPPMPPHDPFGRDAPRRSDPFGRDEPRANDAFGRDERRHHDVWNRADDVYAKAREAAERERLGRRDRSRSPAKRDRSRSPSKRDNDNDAPSKKLDKSPAPTPPRTPPSTKPDRPSE